jgi:glycosyltransferase involved in cell wall biosynthesis
MTAYNREKYISKAIKSVLASSHIDFELIIVDDCSTDKTIEIARKFEAKDSRVKVYVNEITQIEIKPQVMLAVSISNM